MYWTFDNTKNIKPQIMFVMPCFPSSESLSFASDDDDVDDDRDDYSDD